MEVLKYKGFKDKEFNEGISFKSKPRKHKFFASLKTLNTGINVQERENAKSKSILTLTVPTLSV